MLPLKQELGDDCMKNENEVRYMIREFIKENMDAFYEEEDLSEDDNIFEKGYVSSLFAMRLLNFIEAKFEVSIPDDMIQLENFKSINSMICMIQQLKGGNFVEK